jgi:hypothetical protein
MKHTSILAGTGRRAGAVLAAASIAGLAVMAVTSSGSTALAADSASVSAKAVPTCTAAELGVWVAIEQGNGAAGSIYYPLEFTNLSHQSCALGGFPGVSALNRNGRELGSPAGWDHVAPVRTVVLAPGATAHTILRWSDAEVTTAPNCDPTNSATELRVYPPDRYSATYAAFDLPVCSHAGPVYMSVEPIKAGVGTIYG